MQGGRRQPKVFMLGEHRTELGKQTRKEIRKKENRDSTLRGKEFKEYRPSSIEVANCVTTGQESIEKWLIEKTRIRRLTPTECERLQGFPDGWTEGISDTQRYKCLGNAVTTNVIRAIMEKILKIYDYPKR
jgi:site-specific DNA-cytosine methylase